MHITREMIKMIPGVDYKSFAKTITLVEFNDWESKNRDELYALYDEDMTRAETYGDRIPEYSRWAVARYTVWKYGELMWEKKVHEDIEELLNLA